MRSYFPTSSRAILQAPPSGMVVSNPTFAAAVSPGFFPLLRPACKLAWTAGKNTPANSLCAFSSTANTTRITKASAATPRCGRRPLIDSPRGCAHKRSRATKASDFVSPGFRIHTPLVPPIRKTLVAPSNGLVSKCPGVPAKTCIARASAFFATSPAAWTRAFKAPPGLTTLRSSAEETPPHEAPASRSLCGARLRHRRPRCRRRLGARGARNLGGPPLRLLGCACLCGPGRARAFLAASAAPARPHPPGLGADSLSRHRFSLRHSQRAPARDRLDPPSLSRHSGVSHRGRLALLRVVHHVIWFSCGHLRHPSALDLQRQTLLVPRNALRRNSLWSLRESQSFRRICRACHSSRAGSSGPGKGAPRALVCCRPPGALSIGSALPLRLPRWHHQFRCGARRSSAIADSAAHGRKACACRSDGFTLRLHVGFLAGRPADPRALFLNAISRSDFRQTRFHAPGHLAHLPRTSLDRHGTWHFADRFPRLRNLVRRKSCQPLPQRLPGSSCRNRNGWRRVLHVVSRCVVFSFSPSLALARQVLLRRSASFRPRGLYRFPGAQFG